MKRTRYGSPDTEEARQRVGRRSVASTTRPAATSEFGSNELWDSIYGPATAGLQAEGLITSSGAPVSGMTPEMYGAALGGWASSQNTPQPSTPSGSRGESPIVGLLRSLISGGGDSGSLITSAYGDLASRAQQSSAAQQALIDQYYGGAQSAAQQRLNDTLTRLQALIGGARGELETQTGEGRQRIDEATQRALATLGGQVNPYAGLQILTAPVAESPLMSNLQALGQNTQGLSSLRDMLVSESAQSRNAMQDMVNLLSAGQQAAQQSRVGDVELARGAAQQDLSAAQRAAAQLLTNQQLQGEQAAQSAYTTEIGNLQQAALQARLSGQSELANALNQLASSQLQAVLADRSSQQSRRDEIIGALLQYAEKGVDIGALLPLMGGVR